MNLRKWYHDNLRTGVHRITLVPANQIEARGTNWLSTGTDPQFLPMSSRGGLPKGWVIIELQTDQPLQLKFYFDVGDDDGSLRKHAIVPVDVENAGFTRRLVEFPANPLAVRLDPTEAPGPFSLHSISIRELGAIPLAGLCGVNAVRHTHGVRARLRALKMMAAAMIKRDSVHVGALLRILGGAQPTPSASGWFANYRPDVAALDTLRAQTWPENAPLFSIVMPVWNTPATWLKQAIASVKSQTYAKWELICVDDASTVRHVQQTLTSAARADGRIRPIRNLKNLGVSATTNVGIRAAKGDYVVFMDHDDVLEPQALHRFASAVLRDQADMLYGDEVLTAQDDLDKVLHVSARPQLSYDYYVNHPYFVHPIAIRRELALKVGGLDESLGISHDVDFNLRVLEHASKVTHIPDILYRWRQVSSSSGHQKADQVTQTTIGILQRHLARLGFNGRVSAGPIFNTYRTRFFDSRALARGKVAIIVPTKNREDLLRMCVESIEATVPRDEYDLIVVDHESDSPSAQQYFASISGRHRVLPYSGNFNFSKINNYAVRALGNQYTYYLFMNNDIEAVETGWLGAMRDLAARADVGIVGAMLLYPDRTVQHAGVIMGMHGAAEHAHKWVPFYDGDRRAPGYDQALAANRDFSAVTAACLMMRAEVFHEVGGYDEKLVVGFNDVDLCLRVGQAGYRIINSAEAVLIHHESASRGKSTTDPHPEDSLLFTTRYREMITHGDPYFSPLLSDKEPRIALNPEAKWTADIAIRSCSRFLPRAQADKLDGSPAPVRL
jgi:O-antigen biosynthesis protein